MKDWNKLLIALACIFFAAAIAINVFNCGGMFTNQDATVDGCQPENTKCVGTQLHVCNASGNWDPPMDCSEIEPGDWGCCPFGEAECLPEGECHEAE